MEDKTEKKPLGILLDAFQTSLFGGLRGTYFTYFWQVDEGSFFAICLALVAFGGML